MMDDFGEAFRTAQKRAAPKRKQSGEASAAPAGNNWREHTFTAKALRTQTFAPVNFIVARLIPEGVTLLVSKPKLGKSWMVLDLCVAATMGRFTLGTIKPAQGDVLYLALEDSRRRLQGRLDKLLPTFKTEWPERLGWRQNGSAFMRAVRTRYGGGADRLKGRS
jgi:hypothetical protein